MVQASIPGASAATPSTDDARSSAEGGAHPEVLADTLLAVAFNLLVNQQLRTPSNSLWLCELYLASLVFLHFLAIFLLAMRSAPVSALLAAAFGERALNFMVDWIQLLACGWLVFTFMLRFAMQVPVGSFFRASLVSAGMLLVFVCLPLLLNCTDFFHRGLVYLRSKMNI